MTSWQVSESGTTVSLKEGKGELTLTVTNAGTAQDRVVLTITPLDGASDDWFTVEEPQGAVAPGASVVYKVGVAVPPGTAAGSHALQAVAYSADSDPGESSATSKRVGFTVAPSEPKPPAAKWPYIVVALVTLLVIVIIVFLLTRDGGGDSEVPTVPTDSPEAPVEIPSLQQDQGRPLDEVLADVESTVREQCGGELCVELRVEMTNDGFSECEFVEAVPPQGQVERGGTLVVIAGTQPCDG
jgi:hypothetical protein